MCIHTHSNSKLMKKLTSKMADRYNAFPMTLVNSNSNPHEHFTLYAASGNGNAIRRAAILLNMWHPEYAGQWAAHSLHNGGFQKYAREPQVPFPSIEWPDSPSSELVATICHAYGTLTSELPTLLECVEFANKRFQGEELETVLALVNQIRDVPELAPVEAAAVAEQKFDWAVSYTDEDGDVVVDRYPFKETFVEFRDGVLLLGSKDLLTAAYKDWLQIKRVAV